MRAKHERRRRGLILALVLVSAPLGTREAEAFCRSTTCDPKVSTCDKDENGCPRSGAPLSWRQLPLVYRFHAGGSAKLDRDRSRDAIRRAFQTWSNVSCRGKRTSLRFEEGTDIPGIHALTTKGPAPVSFGIYFRDDAWPYDDGEESLALTNQTFGLVNGYIDYAAIEINTTERDYALSDDEQGLDLQAVITHEVGHYIGLAHSRVPDSIMVASYCESGDRCGTSIDKARALSDDDITAACALYPPSGIAGVAYEPQAASCSITPGGDGRGSDAGLVAGLLLCTAASVRRRRARRG